MVLPSSSANRRPFLLRALLLGGAAAATLALLGPAQQATAQTPSAPGRADPLDPQAAVPPVQFSSAFTPYRRMSDAPVGSWREANDTVTRIGGWRAYAREANTPPTPANPAPGEAPKQQPTSPGAEQGHGRGHGHGGHHAPK
jgi:hypothetical protein